MKRTTTRRYQHIARETVLQNATVILHAAQFYHTELSTVGITAALLEKIRTLITRVAFAVEGNPGPGTQEMHQMQELQMTLQSVCTAVHSRYAAGSAVGNFFLFDPS